MQHFLSGRFFSSGTTGSKRLKEILGCFLIAICLTLFHIAFFCVTISPENYVKGYESTLMWDSGWYENIAANGYVSTLPPTKDQNTSNVAFFPGFPFLSRGVSAVSGLPLRAAIPLTAQLACVLFWAIFLLWLKRWETPRLLRAFAVAVIAGHPLGFVLIIGYSESLFLTCMLGFLYFIGETKGAVRPSWRTAICGFGMSATRLIGFPLSIAPLAHLIFTSFPDFSALKKPGAWVRPVIISCMAMAGTLLFFLYCHIMFGAWDLYFRTEKVGWNYEANYLRIFDISLYRPLIDLSEFPIIRLPELNRLAIPLTSAMILLLIATDAVRSLKGKAPEIRQRATLYLSAFFLFFISVSAHGTADEMDLFTSLLRYHLPIHVLLILAVVWQIKDRGNRLRMFPALCLLLIAICGFYLQRIIISAATNGESP
jgi:hypothetical protein